MNAERFAFVFALFLIAYGAVAMRWASDHWPDRIRVFAVGCASFFFGCVLLGLTFAAYCLVNGSGL